VANEAATITGLPEGTAASLPMPVTTYIKVGVVGVLDPTDYVSAADVCLLC
jgi:hypothetical protein